MAETKPVFVLPHPIWRINNHRFGTRISMVIKGEEILFGRHLGADWVCDPDTPVNAIGPGVVAYAEMRRGSENQPYRWGGTVGIEHTYPLDGGLITVVSVYGGLRDIGVNRYDQVDQSQCLGLVAEAGLPESGWWPFTHLHFGIMIDVTGQWDRNRLPGFAHVQHANRPGWRIKEWMDPQGFFASPDSSIRYVVSAFRK